MIFEVAQAVLILILGLAPWAEQLNRALLTSTERAFTTNYGRHETWRRNIPGSKQMPGI